MRFWLRVWAVGLIACGLLVGSWSGAVNDLSLQREVSGSWPELVLVTEAMDGRLINLTSNPLPVARIVNLGSLPAQVRLGATASYVQGGNSKWQIDIQAGTVPAMVYRNTGTELQWTAWQSLAPGASLDIRAAYRISAGGHALFSFQVEGRAVTGAICQLADGVGGLVLRQTYS